MCSLYLFMKYQVVEAEGSYMYLSKLNISTFESVLYIDLF